MERTEKKKNGKRQRLNTVDWLILSLLLAALLLGVLWVSRRDAASETVPIVYTLSVLSVSSDVADENGGWETLIPNGAVVTNERGSRVLGWVDSVTVRPSAVLSVRGGSPVTVLREDRDDLYVRIRADAIYGKGDCYRVGDIPILCGVDGDFRIGGFSAHACRIVRVEVEGVT